MNKLFLLSHFSKKNAIQQRFFASFSPGIHHIPKNIKIVEVGPRDGLQNEANPITTEQKLKYIDLLVQAGHETIESTSFVSPKWVPQMSDHKEIVKALNAKKEYASINFPVLTPNLQGLESALECGVREVAIFTSTSESFNKKNINCSIEESFQRFEPLLARAKERNVRVRGYLSTVLGCPYEGKISVEKTAELAHRLLSMGCYEVSLGDTIGSGTPGRLRELLEAVQRELGEEGGEREERRGEERRGEERRGEGRMQRQVALHLHNTYGLALANVHLSLLYGIRIFDSSTGGIGGCPYAKNATGNVSTEHLLLLFESLGIKSHVNLKKTLEAAEYIQGIIKKNVQGNITTEFCEKHRYI